MQQQLPHTAKVSSAAHMSLSASSSASDHMRCVVLRCVDDSVLRAAAAITAASLSNDDDVCKWRHVLAVQQ
jgi:hypothetical protein